MNKNISDMRLELKNKFEDTYFYSLDGIKLNAWDIKAQEQKADNYLLSWPGRKYKFMAKYSSNFWRIMVMAYLCLNIGGMEDPGTPSETGLYIDLESAIKYLKDYKHIPQSNMVLWGRSLGGAVVADIASRDEFKGVILESTFTNIRDIAIHLTKNNILESRARFWRGITSKFVECVPFTQKFRYRQENCECHFTSINCTFIE